MEGSIQPNSVVVGVDTSTTSMSALDWATSYAQDNNAPLHLIHGFSHDHPDLFFNMGTGPEKLRAGGERVLSHAKNRTIARDNTLKVTTSHVDGYPAAALVRASRQAAIVVVGSRGDSMLRLSSLGETAHQVAAHAQCPVAVVRAASGSDYGRITVGVDRSDHSRKALAAAFTRAEQTGRELFVLHAWQPRDADDPNLGVASWDTYATVCRSEIEASVADQKALHPSVKVLTEIAQGNPIRRLIEQSEASDLIVIGARGRGGFEGLTLGRVAGEVLSNANSPVLVMH